MGLIVELEKTRINVIINLDSIYKNALTIDELLHGTELIHTENNYSEEYAEKLLLAWCKSSCAGDWSLFEDRLNRDKLSLKLVKKRFASGFSINPTKKTRWMIDFEWIIDQLIDDTVVDFFASDIDSIPFGDFFSQIAITCCKKVEHQVSKECGSLFRVDIFYFLGLDLIKKLSELVDKLFYKKFAEFRLVHQGFEKKESGAGSRYIYKDFVNHLRNGGFCKLVEEKPVLARLLSIIIRQWIDSNVELLNRLTVDFCAIQKLLNNNIPIGKLRIIEGGLSDPHNSGRTVQILEFESGFKCLYKPKNCSLDSKWYGLIEKFNHLDTPILLKAPKILDRMEYGWSEYIENIPCDNLCQVDMFYRRSGALTCLLFLVSASDMHYENLIACGEYPVPIDMEMILQGAKVSSNEADSKLLTASELAASFCQRSVLSVGILPIYDANVDNKMLAVGGMNYMDSKVSKEGYLEVNTDHMAPVLNDIEATLPKNLPVLNGKVHHFKENIISFINGFREFSLHVLKLKDVYAVDYFLKDFEGLTSRQVFKPTRFYFSLRKRLLNPNMWNDGLFWSAQADFVSRFNDLNKSCEDVTVKERKSLLDLNIPTFTFLTNSGYKEALFRFGQFNPKVVEEQCKLIESSAISLDDFYKSRLTSVKLMPKDPVLNDVTIFEHEVSLIANKLSRLAIRSNCSVSWIGLDWFGGAEVSRLVPLGFDLYNGIVGISLFLSSFGKYSNDSYYIKLSEDALAPLLTELKSANAGRFARTMGAGVCTGIGSVIYGLTAISQASCDLKYIDHALTAASLLSDGLINSDRKLDIVGGTAGAIVSLLYLYKITELKWVLDEAIHCGDRLLSHDRVSINGKSCWIGSGFGNVPLGGFSHGAAGFAYAFALLYRYTKRDDYFNAANECIDYMNETFANGDWIDNILNVEGKITQRQTLIRTSQWCHGGVGIGLSRLASIDCMIQDVNLIHSDLNRALDAAAKFGNRYIDSLCCGAMGEVEFLSQVGIYYSDSSTIDNAKSRLNEVISQSKANNSYQFGGGSDDFHLSLFRGIAGVGYTILRQLNPSLPNITVFA